MNVKVTQPEHLILEKKVSTPLYPSSNTRQRLLAGAAAWGIVGRCCSPFRTVLPLPELHPHLHHQHSPCSCPITATLVPSEGRAEEVGEGGLLAGVGRFPQGSVAAHVAWDGFDKILLRGRGVNQDDLPKVLPITLRPRSTNKQQSRPPLRGSGRKGTLTFPLGLRGA